jgi:hypothetical protein
MIIGVSGKINAGKDLVGQMIQYNTSNYKKHYSFTDWKNRVDTYQSETHSEFKVNKFAGKLKDIVCILISCTRERLEDRDFKNKELGEEWWYFAESEKHNMIPYLANKELLTGKFKIFKLTPRKMLQLIGTECGRFIIHPDIWINALMMDYRSDSSWVITDVRFPNEAEAIRSKGGIVLRVQRPSIMTELNPESLNEHESERALDLYQFDGIINNSGTIQDLLEEVSRHMSIPT